MKTILERGFESIFIEGKKDLEEYLQKGKKPKDWSEKAHKILFDLPEMLKKLNEITYDDNAPLSARALFPALISYLLKEDDLLPARKGQMIIGHLDDAYLIYSGAKEISIISDVFNEKIISEHLSFLNEVVPSEVREKLDIIILETITEANRQVEQYNL